MKAHQMVTLFGGRMPHAIALVPGGMTQIPTKDKIKQYKKLLKEVEAFVHQEYTNDILAVAATFNNDKMGDYFDIGGFTNMMSYGVFDLDDNDDSKLMFNKGTSSGLKLKGFMSDHIKEMVGRSKYSSGSNLHPYKGQTDPDPHKVGAIHGLRLLVIRETLWK
jgi:hydrogenase large subunit